MLMVIVLIHFFTMNKISIRTKSPFINTFVNVFKTS